MTIDTDAGWAAYLRDSRIIDPTEARRRHRDDAIAAVVAAVLIAAFVVNLVVSYLSGDAL
ncbi:hypothetical protein CH275_04940 [Rhodococcus sp. 06-235-1A]|uniref:hypothetical protein n=1 Tax=Rhodococcus sp. 06-235-1A TaxID=2022508 RepID=UPI000B9B0939|nr:hypothetical protein [Rhodococcus sp. 06-235-1A]OZD08496.1 hypothetical protein CH275_04940 [Rhodococcus sp. 06-235-1A]